MTKCKDCGKGMTNKQICDYFALGCELQREGGNLVMICGPCLREREKSGENVEDLIAEFCG